MLPKTFACLGLASSALAKVQFLGVAIAGGDFGCQIDGTCPTGSVQFAGDASDQMKHFVAEGMNLMRIPTSWQFLVNNQLGSALSSSNLARYDRLIQSCLSTGAYCMLDIHNFARFNGGIIGQGGPTDDQFVSLWTQLASKYASNDKIIFELMNEPHDLDINIWAQTCQKVVTAIRSAGATSQMILLPGTNFDSAATLVSSGSADALMGITNPDGGTDRLLLDIHKYLDEDNSGTHQECVTDNVAAFTELAQFLRDHGRQGLISESGASGAASCLTNFCSQNTFINQNSDVFLGFVAWAAGSFSTSYVLSLTPSKQNGQLVDNRLMTQCVLAPWLNSNSTAIPSSKAPATSSVVSLPLSSVPSQGPTSVGSILVSGTSVVVASTWSLETVTTLLIATDTPTPKFATATVPRVSVAASSAAANSQSSFSSSASDFVSNPVSGSASITSSSMLALFILLLCGFLGTLVI